MKEALIKARNTSIHTIYKAIIRPVFFSLDAEFAHIFFLKVGKLLASNFLTKSLTSILFNYNNPILKQKLLGLNFPNPVGLAAGFDKNAEIFPLISHFFFFFL